MKADVLAKLNQLSPEKQQEVEDFIDYKYAIPTLTDEAIAEKRKKNLGWAKGKIWMADDFMDTPDDFKDYM